MTIWNAEVEASCTVCRDDDARRAYVVDGHQIVRCTRCEHLYVSPRPSMDEVLSIYGAEYFENPAFQRTDHDAYFGYMDYLSDRENIQLRLRQVIAHVEQLHEPGRLLDIGCGPGLFVEVGDANGWESWGVDLNEHAVAWARQHVSPRVRLGTVSEIDAEDESYDCVTMFDVIEHLADPRADLLEVWRAMKPGGILVVVTPDAGAPMSRALGSRWLEMKRAPEHLQFFTVEGLANLLHLSGFTAIEWHSIGKITTLRNILADMRFYADGFFRLLEREFDKVGLADRVFDVDPRTKLCLYARKTGEPVALEEYSPRRGRVRRVPRLRLGKAPIGRAPVPRDAPAEVRARVITPGQAAGAATVN